MLFLLSACSHKKQPMTDAITNRDSVPIMITREVSTYISDSGVVRYKIIADEWKVYDRLDPSRWTFEEGVYLEKYDNKLNIEATILADTAYYYDKQELWELRGNVHIENEQDEQFDTQLLFWNQKTKQVYSDLYIRIRQQKRIITGVGFTSNQDFTNYTIKQTKGIFPIKEEQTSTTDSTTVAVEDTAQVTKEDKPTNKAEHPQPTTEQSQAVYEKPLTIDGKQKTKNVKRSKASDNVKQIQINDEQLTPEAPKNSEEQ
jgi:LPS export ABC transporter protein LptC